MEYTQSLEYAKEIASRNIKKQNEKPTKHNPIATIAFVTQWNRSVMPYDSLMGTCCSLAREFLSSATEPYEYFDWDGIIFDWLCENFVITQLKDYETDYVYTAIEIETPSGNREPLDIETVIASVLKHIREHVRDMQAVPHGKEDKLPLWFGNETTKEHDLATLAKYKGNGGPTVPLGGNFPTTLIKEPITFKKVLVTRVDSSGEVSTVVQQNLVWTGEDNRTREFDYRLKRLYEMDKIDTNDPVFIKNWEKERKVIEAEMNAPRKPQVKKKGRRKVKAPVTASGLCVSFNLKGRSK